jgi:hypothetical protein
MYVDHVRQRATLCILGDSEIRRALLHGVNGSELGASSKTQHEHEFCQQEVQHYKYFPRCEIINLIFVIVYSVGIVTLLNCEENMHISRLIT